MKMEFSYVKNRRKIIPKALFPFDLVSYLNLPAVIEYTCQQDV